MGRLETYRGYVQQLLERYAQRYPACAGMEVQTLYDTARDHYQVLLLGWDGLHRVYESLLHVDIRDGKIWIQEDRTEAGLACKLIELGVSKDDIVLAFHAPYKRPYTGFAVGQ
jgi:XisI protein